MSIRRKPETDYFADEETERGIKDMRIRAYDEYLDIVSKMYFEGFGETPTEIFQKLSKASDANATEVGPLGGMLTSPYRENEVLDDWSLKDIALFIGAITRFGREWSEIRQIVQNKTDLQLTDFYYGVWKRSRIYPLWKKTRKQKGLEY